MAKPAFRDLESDLLSELSARPPAVIGAGGRRRLAPAKPRLLATAGKTVWLTARPETLWQRICDDHTTASRRPNLTADGGLSEIRQILARREPLYRESADWVVDTEDKSPPDVAADILALVRQSLPDPA